jgi:hypothetical protein
MSGLNRESASGHAKHKDHRVDCEQMQIGCIAATE